MVNAIVAFVEALRVNCQLSSKVGDALAKLLHTRLDGDELFNCCKCLQAEKIDLGGKVESMAAKKDGFVFLMIKLLFFYCFFCGLWLFMTIMKWVSIELMGGSLL